jgi:hypothetical protein
MSSLSGLRERESSQMRTGRPPIPLDELRSHRYGRLVVVADSGRDANGNRRLFLKCDCGQYTRAQMGNLTTGRTQSCGCLQRQHAAAMGRNRRKENNNHAIHQV